MHRSCIPPKAGPPPRSCTLLPGVNAQRALLLLAVWLWLTGLVRAAGVEQIAVQTAHQTAGPGVQVRICFNYGCTQQAQARFDQTALGGVARLLEGARDAVDERRLLAYAVAMLYVEAGRQTPIWRDRGENIYDNTELPGAMDCLDHSANTTAFLRMLSQHGLLRYHRVGEPVWRMLWFLSEHWSARVIETASGGHYTVDTWLFDPGTPAVVLPLRAWRAGADPDQPPPRLYEVTGQ